MRTKEKISVTVDKDLLKNILRLMKEVPYIHLDETPYTLSQFYPFFKRFRKTSTLIELILHVGYSYIDKQFKEGKDLINILVELGIYEKGF